MTKAEMVEVMDRVFGECQNLRGAGQAEYAHRDENAFANFERVAERQGLDRKQILMTYAEKHLDGNHSFIKGHRSQRESVTGRINDVIVYMCLLRGMIEEEQGQSVPPAHRFLEENEPVEMKVEPVRMVPRQLTEASLRELPYGQNPIHLPGEPRPIL